MPAKLFEQVICEVHGTVCSGLYYVAQGHCYVYKTIAMFGLPSPMLCIKTLYTAIAMLLQKACGIRNAYKHVAIVVDFLKSTSRRRGANGILMSGHEW
jgi:hypothetical protein